MKLFKYLISLLFVLYAFPASAQGENNSWHFGYGRSLTFTPNAVYGSSNIRSWQSSAAVSSAQGTLLFYTMGGRVWDRNGNEMPNASNLSGNGPPDNNNVPIGSASHGVEVIKNPANANQYYIFTLDPVEIPAGNRKIYYHLVDMSLNNGLGDIVPGMKNIVLLHADISEVIASTKGAACNTYWLVARMGSSLGNAIYAYKIDAAGVHTTPVITQVPATAQTSVSIPTIIFTKAGNTLYANGTGGFVKAQFNNLTGLASNFEHIPASNSAYLCLSPDESKLYVSSGSSQGITQYDLSLYPNLTAISNSGVILGPSGTGGTFLDEASHNLRVGPDQKLYIMRMLFTFAPTTMIHSRIDRLEAPNMAGNAANYTIFFSPVDTGICLGFGSDIVINDLVTDTNFTGRKDTLLCNSNNAMLHASDPGADTYTWNTGTSGSSLAITTPGSYWVYSYRGCTVTIDSFKVDMIQNSVSLGNDTSLCDGKDLLLDVSGNDIDSYLWQDGSNGPRMNISNPGTYYVTTSKKGCMASDTILVNTIVPFVRITESDTIVCNSVPLELHAVSNLESRYTWNTGSSEAAIRPMQTGWYSVTAQNRCGTQKDSVHITLKDCHCEIMIPNAFTPNNDGVNDEFTPKFPLGCERSFYELYVYNRYGQLVFFSNTQKGWDGNYPNGSNADAGVYMYLIKYRDGNNTSEMRTHYGDLLLAR